MTIYQQLRDAIANKQPVRVRFKVGDRDVCPHVIGFKNGDAKVLTYQFAGYSSSGLPPDGEWRCMVISDIASVAAINEEWQTGIGHSRRQTCVDEVDLEVNF
jgi:hypothetical protein